MVRIVIDNKEIEVQEGKTVIEAAFENGMYITHFCWHPELSISGNCRMCLVEVGMPQKLPDGSFAKDNNGNLAISYFPKLQIACATQVSEGMHIRTNSPAAIKAQESVMEFLLINHPLDCPICDEAGQCKLQEYAFRNSSGISRFEEEKVHAPKHIPWGPYVIFDAERCIKCSRCIRFAQEIAHQDVITFVNRNDHVTIELAVGKQFDNPYSMNVIELCPVGALTSRDFRFKARVWDMSFNDSICTGCSRGCNIKIGVRNNEILRIEPKTNPYVNKFWMCDYGRLSQHTRINQNRITKPMVKNNGVLDPTDWNTAFSETANRLKKYKPNEILFLASPYSSNEDNYLISILAKKIIKSDNIYFRASYNNDFADNFLKTNDMTPNLNGVAEILSKKTNDALTTDSLFEKLQNSNIKALYSLDYDLILLDKIEKIFDKLELVIVHATNHSDLLNYVDIVLPTNYIAETEGTIVNVDKRVQHFTPALVTAENLRFMGMKMSRLDKFGAHNDKWNIHELRYSLPAWKIIAGIAEKLGYKINFKNAKDIFYEIEQNFKAFQGMNYKLLDEYMGLKLGLANKPDPKIHIYESYYMKPN